MKRRVGKSIRRVIRLGAYQSFGFRGRRKAKRGPSSQKTLLWMTAKGGWPATQDWAAEPDPWLQMEEVYTGDTPSSARIRFYWVRCFAALSMTTYRAPQ